MKRAATYLVVALAITLFGTLAPVTSRAQDRRPAPDAKLLMARYATSTSSVVFAAPGTILKKVPEIAIYSDGTVLTSGKGIMTLPLRMNVAAIPVDVAQARFQSFYEGLADAEAAYPYNCWNTRSDGTQEPHNCVHDASTATILLMMPGSGRYKSIAVDAGYIWRHVEGMRDFVPPAISISWPG